VSKVKVMLSNEEAADQRIGIALGLLSTDKPVGYKLSLQIADIQLAIEAQVKRYNNAKITMLKAAGAKRTQKGYAFDKPTGNAVEDSKLALPPDNFYDEIEKLNEEEVMHELELLRLSEKESYQPIIFFALNKFIDRS
jgi:hypothetical protein